jgi:hypothetical protein
MATNRNIDPCCANQNPSLNPPILKLFKKSLNIIPAPNENINQKNNRIKT